MIEGRTGRSEHDDRGKFAHMSLFVVSNIGLTLGDTPVGPHIHNTAKIHKSFRETVQSSLHVVQGDLGSIVYDAARCAS